NLKSQILSAPYFDVGCWKLEVRCSPSSPPSSVLVPIRLTLHAPTLLLPRPYHQHPIPRLRRRKLAGLTLDYGHRIVQLTPRRIEPLNARCWGQSIESHFQSPFFRNIRERQIPLFCARAADISVRRCLTRLYRHQLRVGL